MSRIAWHEAGKKTYETGVDRGVLYPAGRPGVPWNGLVSISENSAGGEVESLYFNGVKYLDVVSSEDFEATLEAFDSPVEFNAAQGIRTLSPGLFVGQQPRKTFDLCYRTLIGNDIEGTAHAYKLHLVYNATASPAGRSYKTLGDRTDIDVQSWTISTVPLPATTHKPTAHFVIDSRYVDRFVLEDLESYLYGREGADAALVSQTELIDILGNKITEPLSEPI